MPKMRAVQVARPGAGLELVEREIPQPGPGTVRIKVEACGVCHSDSVTVEGLMPGIEYPRIPGHEVIGTIDALGAGVSDFSPGQRVGVGWHGGQDGRCDACRRGEFFACRLRLATGVNLGRRVRRVHGGAGRSARALSRGHVARRVGAARVRGRDDVQRAAQQRREAGDLVAILGIGGLGHLGVQFAAKMGFRTVAIARGKDKEELAKKLGAH